MFKKAIYNLADLFAVANRFFFIVYIIHIWNSFISYVIVYEHIKKDINNKADLFAVVNTTASLTLSMFLR